MYMCCHDSTAQRYQKFTMYVNVGQRASGSRTWRLVEVIARDGTLTSEPRKGEERGMREQISVARTSQPCLLNGETDGK